MDQSVTLDNAALSHGDRSSGRPICDALRLFDICPKTKCRRTGACVGEPGPCIRHHARIVPEEVWEWVFELLQARDEGLSPEEIQDALQPHKAAYLAWICGVMAGSRSRHLPK